MPVYSDARRWLGVKEGKFVELVDGTEKVIGRRIAGHLVNLTFKQHDKGKVLQVHILDAEECFIIGMFMNSYYAKAFLMIVKNIDLLQEVEITVQQKVEEGKKKGSLFIKQDGMNLKWFWNRDNPGDLPPMTSHVEETANGPKTVWNDEQQVGYLEAVIVHEIIPALRKKPNPYPNHPTWEPLKTGNNIAGDHFGKEQRAGALHGGQSSNTAADLAEPLDDLPF